MWVYQDQEVLLDNKVPQYVLKTLFVTLALKKINVYISYLVSASYVISFWFPIKGWARWPGWTRTNRRERIWSKLKLFKTIWNLLLVWEGRDIGTTVHCNLNDHSPFQSKDHCRPIIRVFVSNCAKTWLLIISCVLTAIPLSLYQHSSLALWKLPKKLSKMNGLS